jgi:hypothetical protein
MTDTATIDSKLEQLQAQYNMLYDSYVEACRALGEATVNQRFLSVRVQQLTQAQTAHEASHQMTAPLAPDEVIAPNGSVPLPSP